MTDHTPSNTTYRLLKFFSRQPIQISRFIAQSLAGLVNLLKLSKTSNTIRLNLQISLPELSSEQHEKIIPQAIRNELTSYFEFFSIWGSSNEKNIGRIKQVFGEKYFHQAMDEKIDFILMRMSHLCILKSTMFYQNIL